MYLAHVQDDLRRYRTPNQKGMTAVAVSNSRPSVPQRHRNQMSTRLNITVIIIAVKPTTEERSLSLSHDNDEAKYIRTARCSASRVVAISFMGSM